MPHVHYAVTLIVTYFQPKWGKLVTGEIVSVSETHILVLVMGLINGMIELEGVETKVQDEDWIEVTINKAIWEYKVGDSVEFKINDIQASNEFIMLHGSLHDKVVID
jgi:ribosomal protein S1